MMSRCALVVGLLALVGATASCTHKTCAASLAAGELAAGDAAVTTPLPSADFGAGSSGSSSGGSVGGAFNGGAQVAVTGPSAPSADRAIAEADIVELGSRYLYAMSKSGPLAIVDLSVPLHPTLAGSTTLPGVPFEMYEQGQYLIAMCNEALGPDGGAPAAVDVDAGAAVDASAAIPAYDAGDGGSPDAAAPVGATVASSTTSAAAFTNPNSAVVLALDVSNPAKVATLATFTVPGQIADSRLIGTILYLTTYQNGICDGCTDGAKTVVTSFDVSDPTKMQFVDQVKFLSNAPAAYNYAWGMAWQRSIVANTQRMYLGGQGYVDPNDQSQSEGIIDVVDVSDPAGHLGPGAHLTIPGPILSRWQMDESNGVLRVVSEQGAGFTGNGTAPPEVDTFTVQSTTSIVPLGKATLQLPMQEGLRTVQFDGPRAYAITFNQTDPLFAIDLSNPALPVQRGQLKMPGWMFYLQPMGTQVIGLGVDRTDTAGNLNVSLFDVSNLDSPQLLQRVSFGSLGVGEDYQNPQLRAPRGPGQHPEGVPRLPGRPRGGPLLDGGHRRLVLLPERRRQRRAADDALRQHAGEARGRSRGREPEARARAPLERAPRRLRLRRARLRHHEPRPPEGDGRRVDRDVRAADDPRTDGRRRVRRRLRRRYRRGTGRLQQRQRQRQRRGAAHDDDVVVEQLPVAAVHIEQVSQIVLTARALK